MPTRAKFILCLIYNDRENKREIPYNWEPGGSEVVDIIRRLRSQVGPVDVSSACLLTPDGKHVKTYLLSESVRCGKPSTVSQSSPCSSPSQFNR